MHALRAAVVDLDGTVWRGDARIDGVREGLDALREAGLDLVFVTNGTGLRAETFDRFAAGESDLPGRPHRFILSGSQRGTDA